MCAIPSRSACYVMNGPNFDEDSGMMKTLIEAAAIIIPLIFAIVFHEVAHGWMARALGDPTAQEQRRLSLNPLRHVDPFGTIILPGALHLAGLPVFGWAKPVPVNYSRLRNPKRDMALVGAAGPAINFVFAVLTAVIVGVTLRALGPAGMPRPVLAFAMMTLINFITVNISLGLFNLLPLPPFDGSRILRGLLPWPAARLLDRIEPFGIIVFFAIFVILPQVWPSLHLADRVLLPPVQWAGHQLDALITLIAGPQSV